MSDLAFLAWAESSNLLYAVTGLFLFSTGLVAVIFHRSYLRKVLCLNVMGSGIFLCFIALGGRHGVDPASQAMVLTGIVVAVASTALALALNLRSQELAVEAEKGES